MADNRDRDRQDWNDDPTSATRSLEDTTPQGRSGQVQDRTGSQHQGDVEELETDDVDELDEEDRDGDLRDDGSPNRRRNIG